MFISVKRGVALPLVLLAMIVAAGFVAVMSSLNQGVRTQIFHTNNHQLSFSIAYSAMARVCAKVHSFSWDQRPFLNSPYIENRVSMQGGYYDLFVENTQGRDYQADVYVRTNLADISRMYFWRIRYNDDLLDVSNRVQVEAFVNGDPADFPSGSTNPFRPKVEDILRKRKENQDKPDQLGREIAGLGSPDAINRELNGRPINPPSSDFPPDPEDVAAAGRNPVALPPLPSQNDSEKPGKSGPTQVQNAGPSGGISGAMQKQAAEIEAAAIEAVKKTDRAWTLMEGGLRQADPLVQQLRYEARQAGKEAYEGMVDFITGSAAGIAAAPGPASEKAIEQYTSQVIVSGVQKLSEEMVRRLERFNETKKAQLDATEDPAEVEEMMEQWKEVQAESIEVLLNWRDLGNRISGYSKPPEVASAFTKALSEANQSIENIDEFIRLAERRLRELRGGQ